MIHCAGSHQCPAAGGQTWKRLSASPLSAELFLSDGVKLNPYRSVCPFQNVLKTEKELCTPCTASIVQMRTGKRILDTAKHTTVYPQNQFHSFAVLWLWLSSLFTLHFLQSYNYLPLCTMDVKALFCSSPVQIHHLLLPFEITFFAVLKDYKTCFI